MFSKKPRTQKSKKSLALSYLTKAAMVIQVVVLLFSQQVAASTVNDLYCAQSNTCFYDPTCADNTADATDVSTNGAPPNGPIYFLGDSIMEGAYFLTKDLPKDVAAKKWTAEADASGGRGMAYPGTAPQGTLPGRTKSGLEAIKADAGTIQKADTVVIELGTNESNVDLSESKSAGIFKTQMETAIKEVQAIKPSVHIYWVNLFSKASRPYIPYVKAYNDVITSVAAATGIDVLETRQANISLSSDGIHPNSAGYKTLSSTIVNALEQGGGSSPASGSDSSGNLPSQCCPTGVNSTAATDFTGDKAKSIFDFFINKGLQPFQAAGITGNAKVESAGTFDPRVVQGSPPRFSNNPADAGSGGYGLFQWTGGATLLTNMKAAGITTPPYLAETQLNTLWYELNHADKTVLEQLKGTTNILDATWAFLGSSRSAGGDGRFFGFERAADQSRAAANKRAAGARLILAKYGGDAPSDVGSGSSSSSNSCCPPASSTTTGDVQDGSPSDWKKMYTGSNKALVDKMGKGKLSNIKILAIHYTVGTQGGQALLDFFAHGSSGDGIQFNVDTNGQVYQYFPLNDMQKTWHVKAENDKAIGIEISGRDVNDLMGNSKQFQAVASLSKFLCSHYNIPCSEPKGDITGDGVAASQGMLGHDELPGNDHSDPDATVAQAAHGFNRTDSSKHIYMVKLRTALGFNPTPGKGAPATGTTDALNGGDTASTQCGDQSSDNAPGTGTKKDPVTDGVNKALALEAVKYDTASNNGKYTYQMGGLHGSLAQLKAFAANGGQADCSGFVRYIIWKVYGKDVGSFVTQSVPSMSQYFKQVSPSEAAAGDIGWRSEHVDFITANYGNGTYHQFGAHSEATNLHGGQADTGTYQKFFRYIGPKSGGS